MSDEQIIALYWERSETAIGETAAVYGRYCHKIAMNILANNEDADECVNDTYARAWNAIPPERPNKLSAFLGKITRNLALHVWEKRQAEKRGGGQFDVVLSELEEVLSDDGSSVERQIEVESMTEVLNRFLAAQSDVNRRLFVRRYWHTDSLAEIAADFGTSVSKAKSILFRMRKNLKIHLESEGIIV
ncbi:MAG: sigma-70 family RNA polymerase sigma factor [Oscillospiraceae bacterium]|nr:sigma-70 family RNA polymerase sigma factor [Oscillospiraceae bacterium]